MLTAYQVLEKAGEVLAPEAASDNHGVRMQSVIINGMRNLMENPKLIGHDNEFFELVDYDSHPILGGKGSEPEPGDIFGTLELLADPNNYANLNSKVVPVEYQGYPEGKVIKFHGVDGQYYIMLVATAIWHFQKTQEGVLFRRVPMSTVTVFQEDAPDAGNLTAFVGPKDEAIAFAQKIAPDLRNFTKGDWMAYAGATSFPDGADPCIAEVGKLVMIVGGYEY